MTSPFIGPQGSAVHLSWQPQTGKRTAQTIGARVISSDHQTQTWALSHTVHFHISFTFPFYIQGVLSANINPAEQVKLACHIKMVSCECYISEWVPIVLGLLTWIPNYFFYFFF